jgi:hypothetical protein
MSNDKYLVDSPTIIYHAEGESPELSKWMNIQRPHVIDISEIEIMEAFKWHIADCETKGASAELIHAKKQELAYLECFFAEVKREGRYIEATKDPEIQKRAKEIMEGGG